MTRRKRVAYLVSHPIQYQAPLLRYITANSEEIDLTAFFMSDFTVKGYRDVQFGEQVVWDIPLLDGYTSRVLPAIGPNEPVRAWRPWNTHIYRSLKQGRFDALWMHGYAHLTNLRALACARVLNIPVFIRAESQAGGVQRSGKAAAVKERLLPYLFRQAAGFLAIGAQNRAYYRQYGVPDEHIWSMPYAVDNAFFQERIAQVRPHREQLRANLNLSPERPVILYVSKLTARKRGADLLEGYIRLSPDGKQEPFPYLLFVGNGEKREELEARAASTGWSSIRFLGFKNQSELPAYFDLCDVFVLVSANEQWGLVINEVMNAGKPVIVSDGVGAAADLVEDNGNGYIIPVGDIATLADRLRLLTLAQGATERREAMGQRSRKRIDTWGFREDLVGLEAAVAGVRPSVEHAGR